MAKQQQQHWAELGEVGAYWGISFMFWVHRYLGRWIFTVFLYPVIAYFWLKNTQGRKASAYFLQRVWESPEHQLKQAPSTGLSFRHFLSFGDAILDKLAAWGGELTIDSVDFDRVELNRLIATGQGALVIASHLGNVDACRAFAAQNKNLKLTVLVHTHHAENFNRILRRLNPEANFELLEVTELTPGTGIMLKERIDAGELVVITGDRTPVEHKGHVRKLDFLGKEAYFAEGPFVIASLLECPVYLLFAFRLNKGRFQVFFEEFDMPSFQSRKERKQKLGEVMQNYANKLAHYAIRWPLQWYNFFDFWAADSSKINLKK